MDTMGERLKGVEPFTFAYTGDWNGEIPWLLKRPKDAATCFSLGPNMSKESMFQRVAEWLAELKKS